jgi:ring-1,2-phenylacetyl-CoA epoxidase subunit PaaD
MSLIIKEQVLAALANVYDPEIPNLNVLDLGMITDVIAMPNQVTVKMIPTYAACPATTFIKKLIQDQLSELLPNLQIEVIVETSIHWDSNRISEAGKEKMKQVGLTPPARHSGAVEREMLIGVACPYCGGINTFLKSPFGSTLCRAIQFCKDCNQTFEQFKPVAVD